MKIRPPLPSSRPRWDSSAGPWACPPPADCCFDAAPLFVLGFAYIVNEEIFTGTMAPTLRPPDN